MKKVMCLFLSVAFAIDFARKVSTDRPLSPSENQASLFAQLEPGVVCFMETK